jgi:rubrerythrin
MEPLLTQSQEFILKPVTIKDILLLSPGKWNNVDYTELEIQKAFNNTDWNDRKFTSLYLDHQDTKERGVGNWVGYIKNKRLMNSSLYGDLEIWNPMIGAYLAQAKAKFGVSATLAGHENKQLGRMEDFHFESFSIVTDPACKPAMINLADKQITMVEKPDIQVVTMENEIKEVVELESVKHRERRENIESVGDKTNFCSALKSALADEKKAPGDYENLKSLTDDNAIKSQIDGIIADERRHHEILANIISTKELNEGSPHEAHTLEPIKYDKKKKDEEELGVKFERQVQHIKDSLKKSHPNWSEEKIKSVAYATAKKMKKENMELSELLSSEKIQAWSDAIVLTDKSESEASSRKENSDIQSLKGGIKMPEIMENESVKIAEVPKVEAKAETAVLAKEESKPEPKAEDKPKDKKEKEKDEKEEMSNDAILNKVKEMSAEELAKFTEFTKTLLNTNKEASAKEVYLAYEKSKAGNKELSANDLLSAIDSRIASLKELDSSKEIQALKATVQELSAKVKTPDRKTLSIAFDASTDSNLGMLNFLQHRIY